MKQNNLNEEEIIIKRAFLMLLDVLGYKWLFTFQKYQDFGNYCICKEDGIWYCYAEERGKKFSHCTFDNLYSLCMFLFTLFPPDERDYCFREFPILIEWKKKKLYKKRNSSIDKVSSDEKTLKK